MNIFEYTQNNPLNYVDPKGLCRWKAVFDIAVIYVFPYAGGGFGMTLESECCRGQRARGKYWVVILGIGGTVLGLPIEILQFTGELFGPTPPSDQHPIGWFSYVSVGASIGPIGASAAIITTGQLSGWSLGAVVGIDLGFSAEGYFGYTLPGAELETVLCCDESDSRPIPTLLGDM